MKSLNRSIGHYFFICKISLMTLLMSLVSCSSLKPDEKLLMNAAKKGDMHTVKTLVEKGTDINARTFFQDFSYYYYLSELDAKSKEIEERVAQRTATFAAAYSGHEDIACYLINNGADIEEDDVEGKTMLMHAADKSYMKLLAHLIKKGADLENSDYGGNTALMLASQYNDLRPIEMLLNAGANINESNRNGYTPLMMAAYNNKIHAVHYLIQRGADIHETNDNGDNALSLAGENDYLDITKLLRYHGAKRPFKLSSLIPETRRVGSCEACYGVGYIDRSDDSGLTTSCGVCHGLGGFYEFVPSKEY